MARGAPVTARPMTFPAPTGGWNSRDSLDGMDPKDAVQLVNIVPDTSRIRLRNGHQPYSLQIALDDGTHPAIKTLVNWNGGPTSCMIAIGGGAVFRVDTSTVTYLGIDNLTTDVWQSTMFATLGGVYTLLFNGFDPPMHYDGTTLVQTTFSAATGAPYGLNQNDLICVTPYQQRLFMGRNGTLQLWYGDVGAIDGPLNCLDLGAYCKKGGGIATLGQWTRPSVYGNMIQMLVIVTTGGEVLLFNGTDPSNAADWTLYGIYEIGEPVGGHRQLVNLGPECLLINSDGFEPLSAYLAAGEQQAMQSSISAKIGNAVAQAVGQNGAAFGWEAILYPQGQALYINVPNLDGTFDQYCVNTQTAAWYRLTGQKAYTWCVREANIYFGTDSGQIMLADVGTSDNGQSIVGTWQSSFQYPRGGGVNNLFTMMRPVMVATGSGLITPAVGLQTDFAMPQTTQSVPITVAPTTALLWDQGNWDEGGVWDASNSSGVQRQWYSVSGIGYSVSCTVSVASATVGIIIHSADVLYQPGGFI